MLSGHVGPVATQQNIDIDMRSAQNRLHPKYPNAMVYRCLSSCSKNWNGHFSGVPPVSDHVMRRQWRWLFSPTGEVAEWRAAASYHTRLKGQAFCWGSSRNTYPKMKHWTPKKARINDDKTSYPAQLNNIPPYYFLCCIFTSPLVKLPFTDENGYPFTIAMAEKHRNCRFQSLENTISLDGQC